MVTAGSLAPMRKLLFALLAVVVLLIAADRVAGAVAERKASDRVASAYGLPAKPGVRIAAFPFPTQVLGRGAEPVTAQAAAATGPVPLAGLHIPATGRDVHFATDG
jgi:LmeA-like phospholipid-binding